MKLDNLPWILLTIAVGSAIAAPVSRVVKMTQMPQLVALFNGVGGGAAALVALLELPHSESPWTGLAIAFTVLVGAVSFSGSCDHVREAAGADADPADHVPRPAGRHGARARRRPRQRRLRDRDQHSLVALLVLLGLGLVTGVLLVLPVGGADVPIVISLLNAFTGRHGRRIRSRARQRPAARRRHPGRRLRNDPDARDGRRHGAQRHRHHLRRVPGRIDRGIDRGVRPAGALVDGRGRRDPARLRAERDRGPRIRPRRRAGAARDGRAGHDPRGEGHPRSSSASTRSPAACPGT